MSKNWPTDNPNLPDPNPTSGLAVTTETAPAENHQKIDEDREEYNGPRWSERLGRFALRNRRLLFWLSLTLATVLRLGRLAERPGTPAELTALQLVGRTLPDLLSGAARQGQPPLGYLLLAGWTRLLGESLTSGRLLTVLAGIIFVVVVYAVARLMFGSRTAIVAMTLAGVAPFQVLYSQTVGPYSWQALLGAGLLGSFYLAWRRNDRQGWLTFAAVALLALYNLYDSLLGLVALDLFFVLALVYQKRVSGRWQLQRLKGWALANLAVGLLYLPWLVVAANNSANQPGPGAPNPLELFQLTNLFVLNATTITTGPRLALIGLILAPILTILALDGARRRLHDGELGQYQRSFEVGLVTVYWWWPILLSLALSYVVSPFFAAQNLSGVTAACYILIARVIQTARKPLYWLILLIPLGLGLVLSLITYYTGVF